MVLVQIDAGPGPFYQHKHPESGTTFRILTAPIQEPILAGPANRTFRDAASTAFYWSATPATYRFQLDTTSSFDTPLVDEILQEPAYQSEALPDDQTYYWRVRILTEDGLELGRWSDTWQFTVPADVASNGGIPNSFTLSQNYPNPVQNTAFIRYALPENTSVKLEIFDTLGRQVSTLINEEQPAGWHELSFDTSALPSGAYFYRMTAGGFIDTKSMILMR